MLQIIGWMGCIYLLVKGFEFLANAGYRNEAGRLKVIAGAAVAIAWLSAAVLFVLLNIQSGSFNRGEALPPGTYPDGKSAAWQRCIEQATNADEAIRCRDVD